MILRASILYLLPIVLLAATPRVEVTPNPVYAGEYGQVIIHFESEVDKPVTISHTKGINFLRKTFERIPPSTSYEMPFLITTAGKYTVPPIAIPDGPELIVPEITVEENGISKEDVFLESTLEPTSVYKGQLLTFTVSTWINDDLTYSKEKAESGPKLLLDLGQVKWRRQPGANTDTRFITRQITEERNGVEYTIIKTRGSCFPTQDGAVVGEARHLIPILIKQKGVNRFADIYNSAPKRTVWIPVETLFNDLVVKELPPQKYPDAYTLGLIGDFAINLWTDKETLDQDDLLTLNLTVTGTGNLEHIVPPDLRLNGWSVYKPNVSVDLANQRAEITWVLQPESAQSTLPEIAFSFFSVSKDKWLEKRFNKNVTFSVATGRKPLDQLPLAPTSGVSLYTRSRTASLVALALYILAPSIALILLARRLLRRPERIKVFEHARHSILKELQGNSGADLSLTLSNKLLPALRALYGLPPGASIDHIRSRLDDEELGSLLDRLHPETYRPSPVSTDRKEVISHLSRFRPLIVIGLIMPFILSADAPVSADATYRNGNYSDAIELYKAETTQDSADISSMVNLGNSYFMDKQYVRAFLCAERSLRVDPRNPHAKTLHQECLLKLAKDPRPAFTKLEPGEWALISAVFWCLAWLLFLTGKRAPALMKYSGLLLVTTGVIYTASIAYREQASTYNKRAAIVMNDVELHYAPESSDGTGVVVSAADPVTILDERPGWVQVESVRGTGWVPRNLVGRLFPAPDRSAFSRL